MITVSVIKELTLFKLHSFHVESFSCCIFLVHTFFMLHAFQVEPFLQHYLHTFRYFLHFSCFVRAALFLCFTFFWLHSSVSYVLHVTLFSCCTYSILHSFHVLLFPCCTLFVLDSFHVTRFSCCSFSVLFHFHFALFPCCTTFMLLFVSHSFLCF